MKRHIGYAVLFISACSLAAYSFLIRELGTYLSPQACNFTIVFFALCFSVTFSVKSFSRATFKKLDRSHIIKLLVLGLCTVFGNSTLALSVHLIDPPVVQAIQRSELIFVLILAAMFLGERLKFVTITAAMMVITGILLLYSFSTDANPKLWHYVVPIFTAFCFAGLSVIIQTIKDLEPSFINACRLAVNTLFIVFFPNVIQEIMNAPIEAFKYAMLAGFVGPFMNRTAYIYGARIVGVSRASITLGIAPVIGLLVQYFFFHEQITLSQILGIMFLVGATSLVIIYDKKD